MKFVFDIGHPAHVHYFKNMINVLIKKHKILVFARKKDITFELLKLYKIKYTPCGRNLDGLMKKAINMAHIDYCILKKTHRFNPNMFISVSSPYTAHVGRVLGKKVIGINDTEHATLNLKLFLPFADTVLTPSRYMKDLGPKQIRFNGYLELMYLHPNWFKPDPSVLDELGVSKGDKYAIVRFVSWQASHDVGQRGFSNEDKLKLVRELEKSGIRPMITSEMPLPSKLEEYKVKIAPHRMHDALYYASLYIGEGGTMASEAAVLGTHSIHVSTSGKLCGTFHDLNKYGLLWFYDRPLEGIKKAKELLENENLSSMGKIKRNKMLKDKIDVTAFMLWFVENYPESFNIMRENPEYQERFK